MKLNRLEEVFKHHKVQNRILAKYFNKGEDVISKWKNNKRQPTITELNEIAQLLRIDIRTLLNESDWSKSKSETYEEIKNKFKKNVNK